MNKRISSIVELFLFVYSDGVSWSANLAGESWRQRRRNPREPGRRGVCVWVTQGPALFLDSSIITTSSSSRSLKTKQVTFIPSHSVRVVMRRCNMNLLCFLFFFRGAVLSGHIVPQCHVSFWNCFQIHGPLQVQYQTQLILNHVL